MAWDLREDGPVRWEGAAKDEYKGPRTGPPVVPGRYTVRTVLAGRTFTVPLRVEADPRVHQSAADYQAAHEFTARHAAEYSALDAALNRLDAYAASDRRSAPRERAASWRRRCATCAPRRWRCAAG